MLERSNRSYKQIYQCRFLCAWNAYVLTTAMIGCSAALFGERVNEYSVYFIIIGGGVLATTLPFYLSYTFFALPFLGWFNEFWLIMADLFLLKSGIFIMRQQINGLWWTDWKNTTFVFIFYFIFKFIYFITLLLVYWYRGRRIVLMSEVD